jgi:crossover junction endodeoxyribonuclease RuvC
VRNIRTARTSKSLTLCGIDPGYDRLGWAVGILTGSKLEKIQYGTIETDPAASLFERYGAIDQQLTELFSHFHPCEAAVESLFFNKNVTTALHVSEARGVLMSCLYRHNIQLFEYTPPQIKLAVTGNGKADKAAVERMLRLQLGLKNEKVLDDAMDAVAALLTHAVSRKSSNF